MQTLVLALLLNLSGFYQQTPIVVSEFHKLSSEKVEKQFIEKYETSSDPSIQAYVLAIRMKQIEYMYNPVTMISLFKKYTKELEAMAAQNPKNIHIRYIRLLIQEKSPSFLGYNDDIPKDKLFLKSALATNDETDFLDQYIKNNTSL